MLGQKAFWPFDPSILHIVKNGHCFIFETQHPFFFYSPTSCFPITTLHLFFHIPCSDTRVPLAFDDLFHRFRSFLLSYLNRVRRAGLEPAFCASLFSSKSCCVFHKHETFFSAQVLPVKLPPYSVIPLGILVHNSSMASYIPHCMPAVCTHKCVCCIPAFCTSLFFLWMSVLCSVYTILHIFDFCI